MISYKKGEKGNPPRPKAGFTRLKIKKLSTKYCPKFRQYASGSFSYLFVIHLFKFLALFLSGQNAAVFLIY